MSKKTQKQQAKKPDSKKAPAEKFLAKNKKAYFNYEVLEKIETGIKLLGSEVKSCKEGKISLKGSFADIWGGEMFLHEMHISPYRYGNEKNLSPTRKRKLLLHKAEIEKLAGTIGTKGVTTVPLEIYLKSGIIKCLIGICRGKKKYDKREDLKKKASQLEVKRALKRFARR